ncbi:hypothetical protein CVT25_005857 [Psilocybe cyanescens]|uniref:UDP-N-acetylglucosamine transferase subunit ALG14 n=1 Tax=Psilocybe cyanescens TaxID=93625 RepID=A0A409VLX3_PSICY|nr:hypothetical protein CVT25_005857 [Psilocybe cyanescens]
MIWGLVALTVFLFAYRIIAILPKNHKKTRHSTKRKTNCSVAVFLGSGASNRFKHNALPMSLKAVQGGHTSEALALISALNPERYNPRTYVVCSGDDLSVQKVIQFESQFSGTQKSNYSLLLIPRARHVHQPLVTIPVSVAFSLIHCIYYLTFRPLFDPKTPKFADALVLNGPGTCFVLCIAVYINKFLGLQAPLIIYVETFARVKSLSLSGKLIRPFADRFLTQWPSQGGSLNSNSWLV